MLTHRPLLLAGAPVWTARPCHVVAPFDGRVVSHVSRASSVEAEHAAAAAADAFDRTRAAPGRRRATVLRRAAMLLAGRREAFVSILRDEGGKPVRYGRDEVARAALLLERCADEAERLDAAMVSDDRTGSASLLRRCAPRGPVLALGAPHAPLLSACQRIAPAVAAGCPIVFVPAATAPGAAIALGEVLLDSGLAAASCGGALSVIPSPAEVVDHLIADARFATIVLGGRGRWAARARAGRRHVRIDPGERAHAVIEADADLDAAIPRVAEGAYAHAGQASAGVQRILVHASIVDDVLRALVAASQRVRIGDPGAEDVVCGPLIDTRAVDRLRAWMDVAPQHGARRLCGGENRGDTMVCPAVYTTAHAGEPPNACGPITLVQPYATLDDALLVLGAAGPGHHTGLFTADLRKVWRAFERLDAGALIHNDYPGRLGSSQLRLAADARGAPAHGVEELIDVRTVVLG